jgi:hypothetical protein
MTNPNPPAPRKEETARDDRDDDEDVGAYRNSDGKWLFNIAWRHAKELIRQGCSYTFAAPGKNPELIVMKKSEHTALLSAERERARAGAIDELEQAVDRKLQSIMAGNLSFLVDSYRRQVNEVFEKARAPAPKMEDKNGKE